MPPVIEGLLALLRRREKSPPLNLTSQILPMEEDIESA